MRLIDVKARSIGERRGGKLLGIIDEQVALLAQVVLLAEEVVYSGS